MGYHKLCDRCRCTDKKYRDKHKEQINLYRNQHHLDNQDKIKNIVKSIKIKLKKKQKIILKETRIKR